MSYETKQLADKLIQLHNSTQILNDVISVLKSSENTVKDDIITLVNGARLDPQFDYDSMLALVDEVVSDSYSAEEYAKESLDTIENAVYAASEAARGAEKIKQLLENVKYKIQEDDKNSDDSDEGGDE